jgi:hypothetical protein
MLAGSLATSLVVLLLSACSDEPASGDSSQIEIAEVPADVPPEQEWAFEDGIVEHNEYLTAFGNFAQCAKEQGVDIPAPEPDRETGLIAYLTPAEGPAATVADACYRSEFGAIDASYQTTNPAVARARNEEAVALLEDHVFPCLEKNGLDVPAVADPALEGDPEFMRTWVELSQAGRC